MANTRNTKARGARRDDGSRGEATRRAIHKGKATHDHAASTVIPAATPGGTPITVTVGAQQAEPVNTPLMSTEDVMNEIYNGKKSRWWVTHNFAPESKIPQGRDAFWPRDEAWAWVLAQRGRTRGDDRPKRGRTKAKA